MGTDNGVKASGGCYLNHLPLIPTAVHGWLGSTHPVWSKLRKTRFTRSPFSLSLTPCSFRIRARKRPPLPVLACLKAPRGVWAGREVMDGHNTNEGPSV